MGMRENLVNLIRKADKEDYESQTQDQHYAYMADRLMESGVRVGDDFQDIQNEQSFCNGKAVMREAVMKMLEAEEELHRGSDQALIRYLIKKIERLEVE